MCEELSSLTSALRLYAASFDASCLSAKDARKATEQLAVMGSITESLKALAAARAAEAGTWRTNGHRSAADELASSTGTSLSAAKTLLETARHICDQPELKRTALRGELSFDQVALISDALEDDPGSCHRLLQSARHSSVGELKDEVARTKAASVDLEERRRRIHRRRSLRTWSDTEGMWHLHASGNPEDGARIMAGLTPLAEQVFTEARKKNKREPAAAYGFDALVRLAGQSFAAPRAAGLRRAPGAKEAPGAKGGPGAKEAPGAKGGPGHVGRGPEVRLLVRIDYDTFLRGFPTEGETCELVGYGPVSVSAVRELIETEDPFVAAILTRGKALVGVAHLGRRPNAYQESALRWLYPSCVVEGCGTQARLERDHTIDWAKTHFTMLDFLDLKCAHHHSMKTNDGWDLVEGTGKRPMVPPGDPRHPRHKKKPA